MNKDDQHILNELDKLNRIIYKIEFSTKNDLVTNQATKVRREIESLDELLKEYGV